MFISGTTNHPYRVLRGGFSSASGSPVAEEDIGTVIHGRIQSSVLGGEVATQRIDVSRGGDRKHGG